MRGFLRTPRRSSLQEGSNPPFTRTFGWPPLNGIVTTFGCELAPKPRPVVPSTVLPSGEIAAPTKPISAFLVSGFSAPVRTLTATA